MINRTKEQWLALFQQHAESGLSAVQFCKERGLSDKHFSLRKKQLLAVTEGSNAFVRVQRSAEPSPPNHSMTASMMLRCGQSTLYFNAAPDIEWLVKLMKNLL